MAENYCTQKDGRTYVYNSTSVYDPATKGNVTVTEYVGR